MPHRIATLILFLLVTALVAPVCAQQQTGQLTVNVTGMESDKGMVRIALFDSEEGYTKGKAPFRGCSVEIRNKRAQCVFRDLPYSIYAFRLYHDANGNNKLDRDSVGMPMEAYAFSNNAKGMMGPAKWKDAKFTIQSKDMKMDITLD